MASGAGDGHTLPPTDAGDQEGGAAARRVRSGVAERAQRHVEAGRERYSGSAAEHLMRRLGAMDVINRGMLFAAVLLLCFFPFLIVANALAGRSAVNGFARRLGLNHQAAADVGHLFAASTTTSTAVTGAGYLLFILGGIAAATALQDLYELAFDVPSRGMRDTPRRLAWLAVLVGVSLLAGWAGPPLRRSAGAVVLVLAGVIVLTAFWWFTMRVLLGDRVAGRDLLPAAVATAVFWAGMEIVFALTFSGIVISNERKYGPIGVVFALMSYLIAIGVVVILGAVAGVMWRERRARDRPAPDRGA